MFFTQNLIWDNLTNSIWPNNGCLYSFKDHAITWRHGQYRTIITPPCWGHVVQVPFIHRDAAEPTCVWCGYMWTGHCLPGWGKRKTYIISIAAHLRRKPHNTHRWRISFHWVNIDILRSLRDPVDRMAWLANLCSKEKYEYCQDMMKTSWSCLVIGILLSDGSSKHQ